MASTIYAHENENWRDLLTAINGTAVTYDAIGNMLNDGTRRYTWQEGRKLASLYKGNATWSFSYDANGMRTSRSERGTVYNYTYHGSQLTNMTYGVVELHFNYDASGRPMSFTYTDATYDEVTYYYMLNLQGDVVGILDSNGVQVVGYSYDAWGRPLKTTGSKASTLGYYNPLRYRGYVYDWETELYYVSSRYYNPEIGRWINADVFVSTGQGILGYNMFAYCLNSPVNREDLLGNISVTALGLRDYGLDPRDNGMGGGGGGLLALECMVLIGLVVVAPHVADETATTTTISEKTEVYDFAKSLRDVTVGKFSNKQPRVHHIVPVGEFSNRSLIVQEELKKAQAKMEGAGIMIAIDPNNLMIVSHGLHKSMHTDKYLLGVSKAILNAGNTKEEIYEVLFELRIGISAYDIFSAGY